MTPRPGPGHRRRGRPGDLLRPGAAGQPRRGADPRDHLRAPGRDHRGPADAADPLSRPPRRRGGPRQEDDVHSARRLTLAVPPRGPSAGTSATRSGPHIRVWTDSSPRDDHDHHGRHDDDPDQQGEPRTGDAVGGRALALYAVTPVTFSSYLAGTRSDSTTSIPRPARTSGPSVTSSRERCAGQPVIPRYPGDGCSLDVDEVECDRSLLDSRAQLIREAVHQPAPGRVRSAISREC